MDNQIEELLQEKKYSQISALLKTRAESSAIFYDTEEFNYIYEFFLRICHEYEYNNSLNTILTTLIDMLKTGFDKIMCFRNGLIINDDKIIFALLKLTTHDEICFIAMCMTIIV